VERWDVVVVGGGPAGAASAAAACRAGARVLLLARADSPRATVCGDGIAPEALDVLASLGLDPAALTAGFPSVPRLRLRSPGGGVVERATRRAAHNVPREVFDARVLQAARGMGAEFRRHAVRTLAVGPNSVVIDGRIEASTVIGADGAESVVRRALRARPNGPHRTAVAIRGYAPALPGQDGVQVLVTTRRRWPAYAWSFPLGDGRANVGYGELVSGNPTRGELIAGLHRLLPGVRPEGLRAHRLPLSTGRPRQPDGRVLLAGDAASLINPLTGEGIFYAVLSGALAGAAAGHPDPGRAYRHQLNRRLGAHLRATAAASALSRWPALMDAALRAAAHDRQVFDDVVTLGLADGRLTARTLAAATRRLGSP
jgi:menaquinone-9 beta-reductase